MLTDKISMQEIARVESIFLYLYYYVSYISSKGVHVYKAFMKFYLYGLSNEPSVCNLSIPYMKSGFGFFCSTFNLET